MKSAQLIFALIGYEVAITNIAVTHIAYCLHTRNYKTSIRRGRSKAAKLWKACVLANIGFYIGKKYCSLPSSLVLNLEYKLSASVVPKL